MKVIKCRACNREIDKLEEKYFNLDLIITDHLGEMHKGYSYTFCYYPKCFQEAEKILNHAYSTILVKSIKNNIKRRKNDDIN